MEAGLRRSGRFMKIARDTFRREGVPEDITWLGQVESAWSPKARSWAAASGLWQFVSGTGAQYGLRQTAWVDERNGIEKPTAASARYLKDLSPECFLASSGLCPVLPNQALDPTEFFMFAVRK